MDYQFGSTLVYDYETMRLWARNIFTSLKMREEDADICADTLVQADSRGVYSHGCMRIPVYCNRIREGGTSAGAKPEVVRQKGATALIDGKNAMGQVVANHAMKHAINLAREFGTSAVSVTQSNHLGACAYYTMMAADENMVGFCWTINGVNIMAPWGGTQRQLGNNPFAIAVPCLTKPHVVLDMAQSTVARGKIVMARKTNTPIPQGWALDADGNPTTDAEKGYWGTVCPVGGYKGYGLALMNAILSAILSNSHFGDKVSDLYELPSVEQNTGHLFQVIDIDAIDNSTEFRTRMDDAVDYLKNGRKGQGVEEIFVPGEPEAICFLRQMKEGITYPVEVIEELKTLSKELCAAIPEGIL